MVEHEIAALRASIAQSYEAALRGSDEVARPIYPPYRRLVAILGDEQAQQIVREVIAEVEAHIERQQHEALEEAHTIENVERWVYGRHKQ